MNETATGFSIGQVVRCKFDTNGSSSISVKQCPPWHIENCRKQSLRFVHHSTTAL